MDKKQCTVEELICDDSFLAFYEKTDPAAIRYWSEFSRENPDQIEKIEEAIRMLDGFRVHLPEAEFLEEQHRFKQSLYHKVSTKTTRFRYRWWSWTAAASIILVLGFFIAYTIKSVDGVGTDNDIAAQKQVSAWQEVNVEFGKLKKINFPDGSSVVLAGGSTLRYPQVFRKDSVVVELQGEGHFAIQRNIERLFTVRTAFTDIQVLGTNFLVEEKGDAQHQISLFSGKISLPHPHSADRTILSPGDKAIVHRSGTITVSSFSNLYSSDFVKGVLAFDKADFEEVQLKFKRYYGIILRHEGTVQNWELTGRYENMTAEDVLNTICHIKGKKYRKTADNHYVLY
ncbi:FecR family protein [Sphingobacterium corticibacterium]|uniref:FecR family protein n=1 Tax=Sphingobacterium corticibacterium TaxID=2484746 RepID=A0A4Q6XGT8_9SPHI|nr:FecR family protein [Sphingobacterium corticibacterium]RZF58723.1 FecR family protein [Sphingobacterium corticibacterium]